MHMLCVCECIVSVLSLFVGTIVESVCIVPTYATIGTGVCSKHRADHSPPAVLQFVCGVELWCFPIPLTERTHHCCCSFGGKLEAGFGQWSQWGLTEAGLHLHCIADAYTHN